MKQKERYLNTQQNFSLLSRRHTRAGCSTLLRAGAFMSLIFMFSLSLFVFSPTYADDTISLSVSTDKLDINMIPTSTNGDFAKSNNMNISVSTTSTSGYTLGIASSTGSTDLINQSDNTAKITSLTSPISESDFSNSSNTQYNNKWGYKPSHLYNSSTEQIITNTDFRPLPGTAGEIIAKTKCANGTSPCTNPVDNYTLSIGTRTTNTTPKGDYVSNTFIITAVTNQTIIQCDSSKLCVAYDGNGLSYPETSSQLPRTVNNVNYNSTTTSQTITKYSHTPNISDDGTVNGKYDDYGAPSDRNEVITIPGATSLHVKITYETESTNYDWAVIWSGSHPDYSAKSNYSSGITCDGAGPKLGGRTRTTKECDITGNTVTFGFYNDNYKESFGTYGYYAIITGTGTTYERSVSSGEYATPTGTNPIFYGWSTSQTTPGGGFPSDVEYTNESEILTKMPGDEGETKTLYAVWQQGQAITFTMDSNVTKIDVLDVSGATVGTITSSGQSITLPQGNTYTLRPAYVPGYVPNTITKTSGAGTLNGKQFTIGAGPATLSVTSKVGGLYDFVADQSKGTQTLAQLRAEITTENSGVYEYNTDVFGTASDAANTSKIYYYRGILDNTTGSYGSDGDNAAWPNTVLLDTTGNGKDTSDTCWRIVRTTGSGGVKMIYQGKWTGSTCANATTAAQVTTNTFGVDSSKYYGSAFGYTQNGSYNSSNLSATYSTMFGSNTSYSANSTDSGIKNYIENTWFTNINSYASKLEPSAGYCNDRTLNSGTSWTTPMSDSTTVSTSTDYYAGAYIRNATATLPPSLTCPRSGADLYTTSSASNGNKQLSKPAALITADEASFAGSGRSNASQGSSYHANSFLRSGSNFWLLSPYHRDSDGIARGFYLDSGGYLSNISVNGSYGVRPAISLTSGTMAASGTGTATDPWIVNP